jgi:hypothetical protein
MEGEWIRRNVYMPRQDFDHDRRQPVVLASVFMGPKRDRASVTLQADVFGLTVEAATSREGLELLRDALNAVLVLSQ